MIEFIAVVYLLLPILAGAVFLGCCAKYNYLSKLCYPVDFGVKIRGKALFGQNKTFRGLIGMGLGSSACFLLQAQILHFLPEVRRIEIINYDISPAWLFGFVLGIGSILGELPNSFLKRQLGIEPGGTTGGRLKLLFFVLDQIDVLLGFWFILAFITSVSLFRVVISVIIVFFVHLLISYVAFRLDIRPTWR